jgi:hypothetical protein
MARDFVPSQLRQQESVGKKALSKLEKVAEKSVETAKTLWTRFAEFIKKTPLGKLADLMPSLTGILAWFAKGKVESVEEEQEGVEEESIATTTTELREAMGISKIPPKEYDLNTLKHPDPNKKSNEQDKDALVGYLKNEKTNWTLCSGTALGNLKRLIDIAGCEEKVIVRVGGANDIDIIAQIVGGNIDLDNLTKGQEVKVQSLFANLKLNELKSKIQNGTIHLNDLIPQGNANMVETFYNRTDRETKRGSPTMMVKRLNDSGKTLCDIVTAGSTHYGHRSMGIKSGGKWYVIDPYLTYKNQKSTRPIPFEKYAKILDDRKNPIQFVIPIDTSKTVV